MRISMQPVDTILIVTAYNAEAFLEALFESLRRQSYQGFQLVFVDDASTDATLALAQRLGSFLGDRMQILHNAKNLGLVGARNAGLDWAAQHPTKYLGFLDADDWFEDDYLLDLYTMAEATQVGLCVAGIVRYDDASQRTLASEMIRIEPFLYEDASTCDDVAIINPCSYAKLFRFDTLHQLRFRDVLRSEDTCYLFDALPLLGGIAFTNKALYHYRVHRSSLSASVGSAQHESMHACFADMLPSFNEATRAPYKDQFETQIFIHSSLGMILRRVEQGEVASLLAEDELRWLDEHIPSWRSNPFLNGHNYKALFPKFLALQACAELYKSNAAQVFVYGYKAFQMLFGKEVRA